MDDVLKITQIIFMSMRLYYKVGLFQKSQQYTFITVLQFHCKLFDK